MAWWGNNFESWFLEVVDDERANRCSSALLCPAFVRRLFPLFMLWRHHLWTGMREHERSVNCWSPRLSARELRATVWSFSGSLCLRVCKKANCKKKMGSVWTKAGNSPVKRWLQIVLWGMEGLVLVLLADSLSNEASVRSQTQSTKDELGCRLKLTLLSGRPRSGALWEAVVSSSDFWHRYCGPWEVPAVFGSSMKWTETHACQQTYL